MDKITIERIQYLHPAVRVEAEEIYKEICSRLTGHAMCRFAFTFRSFKEQDDLYAQGRTAPGPIVTKAKGGQSWHNYGLAIDVVLVIDGKEVSYDINKDFDGDGMSDWQEIVYVFKMHGWEWGGEWKTFKDYPHFQKTFGLTIPDALSRYNSKKVDANNYIRLNAY